MLAAQLVHSVEPVTVLNFPAAQAEHVPPSGPVCPRAQRQAETAVCPVADVTEFTGHCRHTALGRFHPFKLLQRFFH